MAAGSNVYSSEKDTIQQDGALYDLFYAKELSAYGSVENVKALFYLDYVFQSVVAGENVFVGGVKEFSSNYYYHKNTRMSVFGLHAEGTNYILLNDAGLNTFPAISMREGRYQYANYMEFVLSIRSAYYSPTTRCGFRISIDGSAFGERTIGGIVPSNGSVYNANYVVENIAQRLNQKIEIQPFAINDEGEKVGDMITFYTDDYIHRQLATKIPSLYTNPATGGTTSNFFLTQESLKNMGHVGNISGMYDVLVFVDPAMTQKIPDGLYHIMYAPLEGEVYTRNDLGAYTGNKAVVECYNGRVQRWNEGYWTTPVVKNIYIDIMASKVDEWDDFTYNYTIHINNRTNNATGDLLVNIVTYTGDMSGVGSDLRPFQHLGSRIISCPANSVNIFRSQENIHLSTIEIAIGLSGNLSSNIEIAGPSLVPGRAPTPGIH